MKPGLIVDGHLDLAWNALQWKRDITLGIRALRASPGRRLRVIADQPVHGRATPTVSLPEIARGRVGLCFATLLARSTGTPVPGLDYPSPRQAHGVARGQLRYYRALGTRGFLRVICGRRALDSHVADWMRGRGRRRPPPVGVVLAAEGADFILGAVDLRRWHAAGLRMVALSHFGTGRHAGGTGSSRGLTARGRALLAAMRRLGMILDVSHLSDRAFAEALGRWTGPVIASHNNCRALVPGPRQFTDAQVRELVRRGGVIGAALDAWMLAPGWVRGASRNPRVTLAAVADQIDHVCQLAGNARHAAIGSDLDGGFGREQSPADLDTIADLGKLAGILRRRGWGDADVAAVMHGNWISLLRRAWKN